MEAKLWEAQDGLRVVCHVCPHRCVLTPGHRGVCGVRENRDGVMTSLAYGKTVAVSVDPIEKKPLYHFLPGSKTYSFAAVGCNLACVWCQNWEISQDPKPNRRVMGSFVEPKRHVENAVQAACPSISYTYTEPTVWFEYALETMKLARQAGLKNIWVSAGYLTDETLDLILPWLDAANIDWKGTDDSYRRFCGGTAEPVLHAMSRMIRSGVHVEVTTLVVPGVNDDDASLASMAADLFQIGGEDLVWHLSRYFPNYKKTDVPMTPISTLRRAEAIGKNAGLKTIHLGNVW